MTFIGEIPGLHCPKCRAPLTPEADGTALCNSCRWRGSAFEFSPAAISVAPAEAALPDDAACIHHPSKRATAICAGTGDYICSLCAVELNGQTFSTAYLETAGKATVGKAFDREFPRPDSQVNLYLICLFVPYVNFLWIPFAFVWLPHAFILWSRAQRMRREDVLYGRVVGSGRMVLHMILLVLVAGSWVVGVIALIAALLGSRIRG